MSLRKFTVSIFLLLLMSANAFATTYYISPSGIDSSTRGTSASPWRTFAYAIPRLIAGDTLMLQDGTYLPDTTGLPKADCIAGRAESGTSARPITLKAVSERRAWLKGDGRSHVIYISGCSYWKIEGMRASNADHSPAGSFVQIHSGSHHLTFRRNLITNSNRRKNESSIIISRSNYALVEENELYDYHRHGILLANSSYSVVRRNYANSRGYVTSGTVAGIYNNLSGGDSLVSVYPGSHNIIENNISENNLSGINVQASNVANNNRFYGNIS